MELWNNKYKPNKESDLIGNKSQITAIKTWLLEYYDDADASSCVVISGNHGVGKKSIIRILLDECGYKQKVIESTELKDNNVVGSLLKSRKISQMISGDNREYGVLIKNIEKISLKNEKKNLELLYKENIKYKMFPVILLSNFQHSKFITKMKDKFGEIRLDDPGVSDMKKLINRIVKKEKMDIKDKKVINKIILFSQRDIRKIISVLQDLYHTYGTSEITCDKIKEYILYSQKKDVNINLFMSCEAILTDYQNINECIELYKMEKVLLPLMVHENYPENVVSKSLDNTGKIDLMSSVIESLSKGDIIETNIYTDQNWHLQDIHGFYTCAEISHNLNMHKGTSKKYKIKFSNDLNKTSLKNINKKNISGLVSKMENRSLEDLLYMNMIFTRLVIEKNFERIAELIRENNMVIKDVEIIIKIDKTIEKLLLKAKEKKIIQSYIDDCNNEPVES
jgi:DNA polymerase III delta prime subunit